MFVKIRKKVQSDKTDDFRPRSSFRTTSIEELYTTNDTGQQTKSPTSVSLIRFMSLKATIRHSNVDESCTITGGAMEEAITV